jgi:hypothetical protein
MREGNQANKHIGRLRTKHGGSDQATIHAAVTLVSRVARLSRRV